MRQVHGVPKAKKKRMVHTTVRRVEAAQIGEHYRNNPDLNYYYYKELQKENFQKTSKIKTNKLNKL